MARAGNLGGSFGFDAVLAGIEDRGLRRRPVTLTARDGPVTAIDGREVVVRHRLPVNVPDSTSQG